MHISIHDVNIRIWFTEISSRWANVAVIPQDYVIKSAQIKHQMLGERRKHDSFECFHCTLSLTTYCLLITSNLQYISVLQFPVTYWPTYCIPHTDTHWLITDPFLTLMSVHLNSASCTLAAGSEQRE